MSNDENEPTGRARGGFARAKALTPEQRSAIGKKAAAKRWGKETVREALMGGVLKIGNIECYVLDDETRVLSRASFVRAIGRTGKVKGGAKFDQELQTPVFLTAKNLKPFFPKDIDSNSKPIIFSHEGREMIGYRAELLADVCDIFQDALRAGELRPNQIHIAEACITLARGLTRVGIIGLVDEATGYQRIRASDALAEILEKFIARELRPWVKTFPDEFYEQLFRLRGLEFPQDGVKRPQYFGHITNEIVYRRLAPGVLEELRRVTPRRPDGRLKHTFPRRLSEDFGHPRLREFLASEITIMKLSTDYADFMAKLNSIHPPYNETLPLPLPVPTKADDGKGL